MYLVAYDGSEYAQGALLRAVEYADLREVDIEAFTVIPDSERYALDRKWISANDEWDLQQVVEEFHEEVTSLAPEAMFNYQQVGPQTSAGGIAREIRERAVDQEAEVVFLGSEEAGTIVNSISDVESSVASETKYDIHVVRTSPRAMSDLDSDRRDAWLRETDRPKPSRQSDTISRDPEPRG